MTKWGSNYDQMGVNYDQMGVTGEEMRAKRRKPDGARLPMVRACEL